MYLPIQVPGLGRCAGGGNANLIQYSCHGKFHGQGNLAGYSPGGWKRVGHDLKSEHDLYIILGNH